jgi:Icc-related predicted phosphoesterase
MEHAVPNSADILIHAGDFTSHSGNNEVTKFNDYLGTLTGIKHKVVIAGNHDATFDTKFASEQDVAKTKAMLTNCIYLQDSFVELYGIKIYGSPWQPMYSGNGFQLPARHMNTVWDKIPADTDILVTHGPPHGVGDSNGTVNCGCKVLRDTVSERVRPSYHIFGHIHEAYGVWSDGETVFVNASICNRGYRPTRKPILFDIDPKC